MDEHTLNDDAAKARLMRASYLRAATSAAYGEGQMQAERAALEIADALRQAETLMLAWAERLRSSAATAAR